MRAARNKGYLLIVAVVAAVVLGIDLLVELGVATAVLYIIVVWVAYTARSRSSVWFAAIISSLLTVVGTIYSPPGGEPLKLLMNRGLALLAIWMTAALCLRVLSMLSGLTQRAESAEQSAANIERERREDALKRRAMANVLEDLEQDRAALKREIEARQNVQEMLLSSEQRIYAIIESAPTAMVMIGQRGRIVLVNAQTEELFGYSRDELLQQPIEMLVPARFRDGHPAHRNGYFERPRARRMGAGRDLFARRKDGTEFPVEIGLNPIETDEGLFVLSVVVDITERKRAEDEIKRVNTELQQKNAEMQQFVYTVSHDLKSPLVTCKGFVGMMREDAQEGRWDDMLDSVGRVERATDRMGELIEDLLQLSRIGVIRNEPEVVDVTQVVRAIAEDLAGRIKEAGASLTIDVNLPAVVADRIRLTEVFENLLSNAVKYGCQVDSPRIVVGGQKENGEVRYFVQDNGPGIAAEFHDKIFGLFQRLEADKDGTGVGLAAVARIMEVHGGKAGVDSRPGHGATFWVSFPT